MKFDMFEFGVPKFTCKQCPYCNDKKECKDACIYGYCPLDDSEDIGSATVRELREQNGDL